MRIILAGKLVRLLSTRINYRRCADRSPISIGCAASWNSSARATRCACVPNESASGAPMIKTHRTQWDLGDEFIAGFIAEKSEELWEPWMRQADQAFNDARLLEIIQEPWNRLCKKRKTRGRPGTTAQVTLRPLLLNHTPHCTLQKF